jgi:hypothetical protein
MFILKLEGLRVIKKVQNLIIQMGKVRAQKNLPSLSEVRSTQIIVTGFKE